MIQFILRRALWAVVLLLAITMVMYAFFFLVPTDPGLIGPRSVGETTSLREALAIDGPVLKEYGLFLWRIGHGSFGESWASRRNVNQVLVEAMPVTISLVVGGAVLWMLIAVPIGVFSALRPRSLLDRAATVFVLVGISAHPVWIGLILSYSLGARAQLFPIAGYCGLTSPTYHCWGLTQWAWHLFLPWVTFALLYAALYARMIRASVIETITEDYVRTARAKGASMWRVMRSHVLRNAMLPVVTMLGMDVGYWLANAIFVEWVFGLPGIGRLLMSSLARRDLPVVLAIIVIVSLMIVLQNLIVDMLYAVIDPRVRVERRGGSGRRLREHRAGAVARSAEQPASAR